jgi:hypothetical protein
MQNRRIIPAVNADAAPAMPMSVARENAAVSRWLNKPILDSRLLDDMESLSAWALENEDEGNGGMLLTTERCRDGKHSLRLRARTMGQKPGKTMGRPPGTVSVVRLVNSEDWSAWNRLSFWVYPDLPGFRAVSLLILITNGDPEKAYGWNDRADFVLVKNHRWNRVVSEIAHIARDSVTRVAIQYRLQGNEPGAADTVCFDFDHLELQRVEPDYFEGWPVWPGRISYSHTGYQTGSTKTAIANDLSASEFRVIRQETGETVLTKPVRVIESRIGRFQLLDFSEVRQPGAYVIAAGESRTRPFPVDDTVWRNTIWKALNFFYVERCGYAVPGVHDVCHGDWQGVHGDGKIIINGGWHDAGDLSQGLVNTSEAVYAMFALAESLQAGNREPALSARLVEEAAWGLAWVLKTTFHDGYRVIWATMDFWTKGIIGDVDDVTSEARNSPYENFLAAAAEAIAHRVLKNGNRDLAAQSLTTAREDWRFAVEGLSGRDAGVQPASAGILASLELYRATGERPYADKAVELAPQILNSQQRSFPAGWKHPIAGFFYTSPARDRIQHFDHRGHEQGPIVAMARLCEAFPDHPDWTKWYSVVAFHSEYFLKAGAKFTEPYGMLAASVYRDDEHLQRPEEHRDFFRAQVLNGIEVGPHYYLRLFPVWGSPYCRGNLGALLSAAKALGEAARLRSDPEAAELVRRQLEWTLGRNPFCQSLMYGEGHDYAPQYTAMSGDIVGSLPVGIQTRFDRDVPYCPAANWPNWKEVWVHPVSRWIWLMRDLADPAPAECRPDPALDFKVSAHADTAGSVCIRVTARGTGARRFAIRSVNLTGAEGEKVIPLSGADAQTVEWRTRATCEDAPWVAVVIPDGQLDRRAEVIGPIEGR